MDLHPFTRIPGRLLTGPLDWADVRLLFWLVRGGAQLLESDTWEVSGHEGEGLNARFADDGLSMQSR